MEYCVVPLSSNGSDPSSDEGQGQTDLCGNENGNGNGNGNGN